MNPVPVTLEGRFVRLEPLSYAFESDLVEAAQDHAIWEFLPFGPFDTAEEMHFWIAGSLKQVDDGQRVWFATVRRSDDRAVGATSYMDLRREDRGLEIGGTWLTPTVWRTPINTEAKYLQLKHAFEELGCIRVQLKTDLRNIRSQRAIERLGAVKEGLLRKHMLVKNGLVRDTVMYSIIDTEWPLVKARLERLLERPSG